MRQLSVIVVSYNTVDLLRHCLASVWRDVGVEDCELFVVDNASTDGSHEMVSNEFPQAGLIRNQQNLGFARANNQAIEVSSGRYVLLLNADAQLFPGCCAALMGRLEGTPGLGICGPAILNQDGSRQPSWGNFPSPILELAFQSLLYKVLPVPYPYGRRVHPILRPAYSRFRVVDWVTAAAQLVRRNVIDKIGLLPEGSFMYNEDVEYCYRARQVGFATGYEPSGQVIHLGGGARASYEHWIESYTRGSILYYESHFPPTTVARMARLMRTGNWLRYYFWLALGTAKPSMREEAKMRRLGYRRAIQVVGAYASPQAT